jgi:hypothetical protein
MEQGNIARNARLQWLLRLDGCYCVGILLYALRYWSSIAVVVLRRSCILEWPQLVSHARLAMFRVSRGDMIEDAESIDGARANVRGAKPGRYHVDEVRADPFPSGPT